MIILLCFIYDRDLQRKRESFDFGDSGEKNTKIASTTASIYYYYYYLLCFRSIKYIW